ncbi:MAG TPA: beta-ketoacyl synthase N-terminal-like domain-containing protein, partial [Puia sp.]|nr:beta-ketoacyl synthase N-terminal-like domain-containing protein [Puia sp.]
MRNVYVVADNIFSPLGKTTSANMEALKNGHSAIREHNSSISPQSFYASLFPSEDKSGTLSMSGFERIIMNSASEAIQQSSIDTADSKNGFILSSTKGNISLVENISDEEIPTDRISLNTSANIISKTLGFVTEPLVVSHACISGLLAMITGMRLIQSGRFENLVISGGDLITSFIYSGFQSFQAISPNPCKPFDAARDGISLGEAAATVVLSARKSPGAILLGGGSVSNDANHISGPSRTGEELFLAISRSLKQASVSPDEIDFISAHGTATRYNDEMEAKAFHLASLEKVPVNSLKGYYGHTLGAAGVLESIVTMHCMKEQIILPSFGFTTPGTENPIHIIKELMQIKLKKCLKTASGFGGCNAAVV